MFLKFFRKSADQKAENHHTGLSGAESIDPEMYYCPSCNTEYRLNIPACLGCAIPLISGIEKAARAAEDRYLLSTRLIELQPGEELVSIRKGSLQDIKYFREVLKAQRIPTIIAGDEGSCGQRCCGPEMYLQIRKDDVPHALKVLAEDFIRTTALDSHTLLSAVAVFDPQAEETTCPACGCCFSPTVGACPDCGLSFE